METKLKILVADDELSIRRLFEIGLRDAGFEVITVKNGHEAVDRCKKEHFDLVIVDLRMPGIDGLTTIEKIKAINPDLPVILQGSFKNEASENKAKNLGVIEYLTKPFEWSKMLEVISKTLKISIS